MSRRFAAVLLATSWLLASAFTDASAAPQTRPQPAGAPPAFVYYYIWFDESSWNRAKTDYPLLGRYRSDDEAVVRQHMEWMRDAGATGVIVSWKSTERLNRRLELTIAEAKAAGLKIIIIYQGLDFHRDPLPTETVEDDLREFVARYGDDPVFAVDGRATVIWSGSWEFSTDDIARVADRVRPELRLLASEKDVAGYERVAEFVDGDAYYWSSVDPVTTPGHKEKLAAMAEAIRAHDGYWLAPAPAGFDARLLGGTRVVDRRDGDTLRRSYAAAVETEPDAVGIISWNEFSENSHIEPSEEHGTRELDALRALRRSTREIEPPEPLVTSPEDDELIDDGSAATSGGRDWSGLAVLALTLATLGVAFAVVIGRQRGGSAGVGRGGSPDPGVGEREADHREADDREEVARQVVEPDDRGQ